MICLPQITGATINDVLRLVSRLAMFLVLAAGPGVVRAQNPAAMPDPPFPHEVARMYPRRSADVWRAIPAWLKTANIGVASVDSALQQIVTKPVAVNRARFGFEANAIDPSLASAEVHFYIFVSPFAEPARVYVGAVTDAHAAGPREPALGHNRMSYAQPLLSGWVLTQLDAALGAPGTDIPGSAEARRAAGRTLMPDLPAPCVPAMTGLNPTNEPRRRFFVEPIYPADMFKTGMTGHVLIIGSINEDGAFAVVDVRPDRPVPPALVSAARGAAALWRYEPGRLGGCPIAVRTSVTVTFNIKRH